MCNLYSITTNQAAIIALFRVVNLLTDDPSLTPKRPNTNVIKTIRPPHPSIINASSV
jgi:hypothetical protein